MKRILVLGGSGFVGHRVCQVLAKQYEVYGTYHTNCIEKEDKHWLAFDLSIEKMDELLNSIQPDVIVSSLRGEFSQQLELHRHIADYIKMDDMHQLIFISTANVFDNDLSKPHYESEETNAQSDYGTFKAECEKLLQEKLGTQCIIIRIPAVWGVNSPRIKQLESVTPVSTVAGIDINITTDQQIAESIEYILQKNLKGIFHIGSVDQMDFYKLQLAVCEQLNIKLPEFQIETEEEFGQQVLYSERKDMPDNLMITIHKAIASFVDVSSDSLTFRKAAVADVDLLIELYNTCFYEDYVRFGFCPAYGRTVEQMINSVHAADKHIVMLGEKPIGILSVQNCMAGDYYLGCLGIIPEYQHKGYGTKTVQFALEHYSDWKKFSLCTPAEKKDNVRFYHDKLGFDIVGSNMNHNVEEIQFELIRQ